MSKGYPDYFGTSIWPKYGTALLAGGDVVVVPAGQTLIVLSITGAGVLEAGSIIYSVVSGVELCSVIIYIDGESLESCMLDPEQSHGNLNGSHGVLSLAYHNVVLEYGVVLLTRELPFHDSVTIYFTNGTGVDIGMTPKVLYYKVV